MKLDTGIATSALADVGRYAAAAEDMGFDALWSVETSQDPYLPLALVGEHTSRLSFGPAIAVAFPRSPLVHAQLAWDVQVLNLPGVPLSHGSSSGRGAMRA